MTVQSAPLIMVIDNEAAVCDVIGMCLREEGLNVITAYDEESACRLLMQQQPSVIILDAMLSDSGSKMQQLYDAADICDCCIIPVILSSTDRRIAEKVDPAEFAGILPKPFDIDELITIVNSAITGVKSHEST